MASWDNAYSRLVALAKIVLPLVALAILSTLFLVSRTIDPTRAIPYAEVDVEQLAREQGVGKPRYTGVTGDGSSISLTADTARPEGASLDTFVARTVSADIHTAGGLHVTVTSQEGRVDSPSGQARLSGRVKVVTSTGYTAETGAVDAALDQTHLVADGPVAATGPLGQIDAGRMELTREGAAYVLVFTDGVKLVYAPAD